MKGQLITSELFSLCLSSCSGVQGVNVAKKGQCVHDADNVRGKDGGEKMEIGCWRCKRRGKSTCSDRRTKKEERMSGDSVFSSTY
ncbi:hypothetical protein BDV35DRAFT_346628 [Aspergillus flavus]|uniref:Secreted protein n=2 Tax=Aspergillus subgen. Circumdati TaxID=2720871 RepID=A0A5N6J5H1_9EURO|nr:hypothetical protein BDV35DRAFT_346628 [Aspergillus flavus]KAB8273467.1 hypothetical protein BDV30DRAFT_210662 [Aspergillus minisclerotigenes]